jgi:hypothetical protein
MTDPQSTLAVGWQLLTGYAAGWEIAITNGTVTAPSFSTMICLDKNHFICCAFDFKTWLKYIYIEMVVICIGHGKVISIDREI